jgi:hypothetical protein
MGDGNQIELNTRSPRYGFCAPIEKALVESENPDPKTQLSVEPLKRSEADGNTADESSKKIPAEAPSKQTKSASHLQFLAFAISYAVVLFFSVSAVEDSAAPLFPIIAGVYSTVLLVALWSVFGPGSYFKRMFWAHLFGAIPALGLILGTLVLWIDFNWNFYSEYWFILAILLLSLIPILLGTQLPFWFFRSLFGWQFVYGGEQPERAFSLRDAFVLTFLFALCFATPQMASNLQSSQYPSASFSEVGMTITEMEVQSDGSFREVERVLTAEDVTRQQRQKQQQAQMAVYAGYGPYVLMVFLVALLSVPFVLFVFRFKNTVSGYGFTALYMFCIWLIPTVIFIIGTGGTDGVVEFSFYAGLMLALCASAFVIPLLMARVTGLQLTSPKRFQRERRQ